MIEVMIWFGGFGVGLLTGVALMLLADRKKQSNGN